MISVIVCTRNRAVKLERCLRHMAETTLESDFAWQLVIVDNDSEDDTSAVITQFARSLPLQYAFEAKRGVSHARNRGIVEARYPIIAFTDDDCIIDRDWVGGIVTEFANNPGLSILGGRVELADAGDFRIATRIHNEAAQITTIGQIMTLMIGCNMAFRRSVFDAIGLFDPAFGKGTRIGSAEDVDFLYRALKGGSRIAYSPDIVVRHAHGRNTTASLESVMHDYVRGRGAFYCKFIRDRQIARMAYWEVRGLLRERLRLPTGSQSPKWLHSLAAGALYKLLDGIANGAAGAVNRFTD